jgi:thioredoxin reductase
LIDVRRSLRAIRATFKFNETNVPGVFAVGDARSGSVKRVGGAFDLAISFAAVVNGRNRDGEPSVNVDKFQT